MPTVTNATLSAQIAELAKAINQRANTEQPAWETWQSEVKEQLLTLGFQIDSLAKAVEKSTSKEAMADNCPFRDDIRRAGNNLGRLAAVEEKQETFLEKLHTLKTDVAVMAAKYGGITAAIVTVTGFILTLVAKAKGWW